ncbi:hypothetical protein Tco_1295107 [Tanacetum coccineum]
MMLESIKNGPLVYPTIEEEGLPPDVYALVNHFQSRKDIWERVKLLMKGDDPIACLNKAMAFMSTVVGRQGQGYIGTGSKGITIGSGGEGHMARQCTQPKRPRNATWFKEKLMLAEAHETGQVFWMDEE